MTFVKIIYLLLTICGTFALDKEWWKHASIYQIYPKSFKDSNGDGIGDFKGIISKLDYLVDIGVDTIYMNPFYPSSGIDGGYDITDYKAIDPIYGTMEDFEQLIREMRSRGLHLLADLVINHSSDEHEWFHKSVKKIHPYTDYYIWADPKGYDSNQKPIPPNNWVNFFFLQEKGSAWTWVEERKQFYFSQMQKQQPDLNLRNKAVKEEIWSILKFWLDKGVSGFRVDAPMLFMEDEQLRDNEPITSDITLFNIFEKCEHTLNHPDTFRFINELYVFLQQYDRKSGKKIQTPLFGETYGPIEKVMKYYGTKRFPGFHLPLNYYFTSSTKYLDAREIYGNLQNWLNNVPKGRALNWALGNHDYGRISDYFNPEYNSILLALTALLPGTSAIYYGEEMGMIGNHMVAVKDAINRFCHRTPMHWDNTRNAGFTTAEVPWLPVHPNYWYLNVRSQQRHENSTLNYFKDLMSLRKTDEAIQGDLKFHIVSKWVLTFSRNYKKTSLIIAMNLGTETQPLDLYDNTNDIPTVSTVVAASPNSGYKKGFEMRMEENYPLSCLLRPHSVIVLKSE